MNSKQFIARATLAALLGTGVAVVPALTTAAAADQTQKTEKCMLKITGMTCSGCAVAVKMAAKKVDGVADASVSYENGRAEVTYDPTKTTPEKIAKAITDGSGFKAELQTTRKEK